MDAFVLKIIAMIAMVFDHTGYLIFDGFSYFNYIGRLAFPIFAFQIAQGYIYTKNLKRYVTRLFLLALISQIPFTLFLSIISDDDFILNIFFTLALGLCSILIYDRIPNKTLGILISICFAFIANLIHVDYGLYGVSIITLFYIFRNNKYLIAVSFIVATALKYARSIFLFGYNTIYIILCLCTMSSLFFILNYNGKKGINTKYLLYFFYPIHLLVIYGIYLLKI